MTTGTGNNYGCWHRFSFYESDFSGSGWYGYGKQQMGNVEWHFDERMQQQFPGGWTQPTWSQVLVTDRRLLVRVGTGGALISLWWSTSPMSTAWTRC